MYCTYNCPVVAKSETIPDYSEVHFVLNAVNPKCKANEIELECAL